jgi:adenosylcobinamide kinase/adenosylcobinamide-phosphate guanylyltransferase
MVTVEESFALADALRRGSEPQTLVVIDCLTLWLTHLMMPLDPVDALDEAGVIAATKALCAAIAEARGPVVLVGNEIGLGVIPLGREVRVFVDALGRLNQAVAACCERVTFMAAGLPLTLKETV